MRLAHLTNKRIFIARKTIVSGDKLAFTTTTSVMANIQPATNASNEIEEGVFGKSFKIYCDGTVDLQPGDRLRDDDSNYYTVQADGVSRRTMGSIDYLIAVIQKTKN